MFGMRVTFKDVCSRGLFLFEREDDLPIILHAHDRPTLGLCFVESFVQATDAGLAVVCPFPLGVVMMDVKTKARARTGSRPLEHLQVAVGISERGDGTAADVHLDANGFARFVVNELNFGWLPEYRLAVAQLELQFAGAADDLLRRNAIDLVRKSAHKLDATAGDDEGFEFIR